MTTTAPTRTDGHLPVQEAHCPACSTVAGVDVGCRSYTWEGRSHPAPPAGDVEELRRSIRGVVLTSDDDGWAEATGTFNLTVRQDPDLVVLPADPEDVVTVMAFARRWSLQVAPQRRGHNAGPLGSLAGTILLRTDLMRLVLLDGTNQVAVVGAGARWADVVPRASELGMAALHGSTPDVSVVGFSLGGGLGWYGRAHGLAANSITALQVVTADGRLRWVDHDHEPDLFWALRGGGGSFGVVTAARFRLFPVERVYGGVLFFPAERSAEVLRAWREWSGAVPDTVTSVGRMLSFPAVEDVPEPLRGRSFAVVEAVVLGGADDGEPLLAPLRRLGPVMDTFAEGPPAGIAELHMDPSQPLPYAADHLLLSDLTPEAVDRLVAAAGPDAAPDLVSVEVRHLGGALAAGGADHGAVDRLRGQYLVLGVGAVPDAAAARRVAGQLTAMTAAVDGLRSGLYPNFTEHSVEASEFFPPRTLGRLQQVRADVDPDGVIRANHPVDATRSGGPGARR